MDWVSDRTYYDDASPTCIMVGAIMKAKYLFPHTLGVVNEMGSNRCPEIFKTYLKIKTNHNDLRTKN